MFANAIALNEFQLGLFEKMIPDFDEATLFQPAAGTGTPRCGSWDIWQ